ncbi:MAG: hypothetical protein RI897_4048 [Verrucomicrobiota bacterium]
MAFFLDEEEFIVGFIGREVTDSGAIQCETVQRCHFQNGMLLCVVVFLDPVGELTVEGFERTEVQRAGEELVADGAEEAFDFSLGRAVAHGGVMEQAADAGADLDDFFGGVDGAVIDVEGLGNATFVEGGAKGLDERIHVLGEEELTVTTGPAGVIEESDEAGLRRRTAVLDVWAKEGVGLPHLVGMSFGERQTDFVGGLGVALEHFVLFDQAAEGVGSDLSSREQSLLDAEAVEERAGGRLATGLGKDFAHRVVNVFQNDLAGFAFVGAGLVFHDGDAVFLKAGVPGLDGAPGELAPVAILVGEDRLAGGLDARGDAVAGSHVDSAQDAHFEISGWIAHKGFPFCWDSMLCRQRSFAAVLRNGGDGKAGRRG